MAATLGLDPQADEASFVRYFAGDVGTFADAQRPWATPYAVSVFGQPIPSPDPFGRGNAYGDGRAVTLGEFTASPFSSNLHCAVPRVGDSANPCHLGQLWKRGGLDGGPGPAPQPPRVLAEWKELYFGSAMKQCKLVERVQATPRGQLAAAAPTPRA